MRAGGASAGPRDLAAGKVVVKRGETGAKEPVAQETIAATVNVTLEAIQRRLYSAAKDRLRANTVLANSIGEVESILRKPARRKAAAW